MGLQPGQMVGLVEFAEADGRPLAGTLFVVLLHWSQKRAAISQHEDQLARGKEPSW